MIQRKGAGKQPSERGLAESFQRTDESNPEVWVIAHSRARPVYSPNREVRLQTSPIQDTEAPHVRHEESCQAESDRSQRAGRLERLRGVRQSRHGRSRG